MSNGRFRRPGRPHGQGRPRWNGLGGFLSSCLVAGASKRAPIAIDTQERRAEMKKGGGGSKAKARKEAGGDVCSTKAGGGRLVVVFV